MSNYNATARRKRWWKDLKLSIKQGLAECYLCGSGEKITLDHILPRAKGGKTVKENIRFLCYKCNQEKSDKDLLTLEKVMENSIPQSKRKPTP